MDDVIERLRRLNPEPDELTALPIEPLLRRLDQQTAAHQPDRPNVAARHRLTERLPSISTAVAIASVTVALVIGTGALLLAKGHDRSVHNATTPSTLATSARQRLIDTLAVLRRPQTSADLNQQILSELRPTARNALQIALQGAPDTPLMRLATVTSWGEKIFLVPMKPATENELRAAFAAWNNRRQSEDRPTFSVFTTWFQHKETLCVFYLPHYGGGCGPPISGSAAGGSVAAVRAGRVVNYSGDSAQGDPVWSVTAISVVPDGVTRVAFVLHGRTPAGTPAIPGNQRPVTATVEVHGNIAAAHVKSDVYGKLEMIWYGQSGQVLHRSYLR